MAHSFVQVNRQKTTVKKKIKFFEKLCCFFIHIFKPLEFTNFLLLRFRKKVLRPFVFLFISSSIHSIGILSSGVRKCVDLVVIYTKGREETFAISLQNRKGCVCLKYLTLV